MKKIRLVLIALILMTFAYASTFPIVNYESDINPNQDTLQSMTETLHKGIPDSAYPGFVFLGAKDGQVFYYENGGNFTYDNSSKPMEKTTIFDMASITKVMSTTIAAMLLYDKGKLDLDQKVAGILPGFSANGKENVTFRHLLTHSSGLPAWNPLFKNTDNPEKINSSDEMVEKLLNLPLQQPAGEKTVYSCMGFITLGKAIEKITGKNLDEYVVENIYKPLGMNHTFYNPDEKYYSQIAPTEIDSTRGGVLQGKTHDENGYYLNGISGNAGLFSTAEDIAIFCQMMLNKGTHNGVKIFKPETVELFTKLHQVGENQSRGLGWQKPTGENSAGKYFSPASFGHTGYTGTALWIDPEKQLFGIFLTNRVYPSRNRHNLYKFRSKVFDKLQKALE